MISALNVGCGSVFHSDWVNVDIEPCLPEIQSYDIRSGLPFAANSFDNCYTSHLIEHLSPSEARQLLVECFRVLKPQGVIRVVVPDLETIVKHYLSALEQAEAGSLEAEPNYDWMMLELYDQSVRSISGGEMGQYLNNPNIANKEFILSRVGTEVEDFWFKQAHRNQLIVDRLKTEKLSYLIQKLRKKIAEQLVGLVAGREAQLAFQEGVFRRSGEIHRWMYDRFSLRRLLHQVGFVDAHFCQAHESRIPNFNDYGLDVIDGRVRKPDSLFMEGIKP